MALGQEKKSHRIAKWFRSNWVLLLLAAVRIGFGLAVGIWFPASQVNDDALMIEYASLKHHFLEPNMFSLVKFMGYPVFLTVVRYSHIPYAVFTGGLWFFAAWTVKKVFEERAGQKWLSVALYVYVLFLPVAFEQWSGTRMYRNAILTPLTIMILGLMLLLLFRTFRHESKLSKYLVPSILLGIVFSFTYYVKEDGIWLLACLLLFAAVLLVHGAVRIFRRKNADWIHAAKKSMLSIIIPFGTFVLVTLGYLAVNQHFFGVFETNTRSDGAFGEFVEKVYRVASDERTEVYWTPNDAIDQVFEVSETLKSRPEIYENLQKNPWSEGDLKSNPLPGDLFGWAMRFALDASLDVWNEAEIDAMFEKVNAELDAAFSDGRLKEDTRIRILPSAGSRTLSEILGLSTVVKDSFEGAIFLKGYRAGIIPHDEENTEELATYWLAAADYANTPSLRDYSKGAGIRNAAAVVAKVLFWVYRIVNGCMLAVTVAAVIFAVVRLFAKKERTGLLRKADAAAVTDGGLALFFLALGVAYAFAISWYFASFLFPEDGRMLILNFYNAGLPAILTFFYGFGITLAFRHLKPLLGRKHA